MGCTLPRYHFIIRWPDRDDGDPEGTRLANVAAAQRYAERVIRELKEAGGYDDPGLLMVVADGDGNEILAIPFTPA
jgi:hypothetical protein